MELGLCIEMVFRDFPFEQRLAKAAEIGFKNVEMWMVNGTYKGSPEDLARLGEQCGVRITNTVICGVSATPRTWLTNPPGRDEWLRRAKATIKFTADAQIPATIICAGNVVPGLSDAQMMQSVIEGLKPTVEMAEKAGLTLLLEPLNTTQDHPGYWLTSSDRGAEICRAAGSPPMRLLFDCYHMQIMEGDLVRHIERNIDVIGHFHAAGVPGRNELYKGEINYPFLLEQIQKLGYQGGFSLEYKPSMDDDTSLRQTLNYLAGSNSLIRKQAT